MRRRIQFRKLLPLIILFLVCVFLFSVIRFAELAVLSTRMAEAEKTAVPNKTITRDGVDYFPRQDIDVYLLMGIDRHGTFQPEEPRWHADRADTIVLVIFDHKDSTIRLLASGSPGGEWCKESLAAQGFRTHRACRWVRNESRRAAALRRLPRGC